MTSSKTVSLFLLVIALFGLYLESQNKLVPILDALVAPTPNTTFDQSAGVTFAQFAMGLLVYFFCLTLMSPRTGFLFTLLLVLGALSYNIETNKDNPDQQVLNILFNPAANNNFNWQPANPSGYQITPDPNGTNQ